ncbi:nicotinate-nucleotide adenylyltransferase, partial [Alcanivorax marinus]|nr:nicotinate-nucleotide adenylyltransferase [Alloalcanivorax marinus]
GRRLMLARPVLDVAATDIRETLRAHGDSPLLTPAVRAHIHRHGLYNQSAHRGDTADNPVHVPNEAP